MAPAGVKLHTYAPLRSAAPDTHYLLQELESSVLLAEACASVAMRLKQQGFTPDVIIAHPGWGEALFIKDVFPQAKLIVYCEYYYADEGQDVGFDPEAPALTFAHRCRLRLRNTNNLQSLSIADAAIAPTQWQKSTYPAWAQARIEVIHDGIDFARLRHNPAARFTVPMGVSFKAGDEILTYVARNLEPVRGFHMLMRTLPEVLAARPNAHVLIVGGDDISYGHLPPGGGSWRAHLIKEVGATLDLQRVHFLGTVSYQDYINILHVSKVHAYWTTPFVLSWSFLEAIGAGAHVIASDTAPVTEFAGMLKTAPIGFFDTGKWAVALTMQLRQKITARQAFRPQGTLDINDCVQARTALLHRLAETPMPRPVRVQNSKTSTANT